MGIFDGILSNITSPIASLISGGLTAIGQERTNAAQASLARDQMDFQERMSSTAYQRATKDMQAAGLNPMLAYQQGGSSTPGGAMATLTNSLGAGVSTAQQSYQLGLQTDLQKSQIENIKADTAVKENDSKLRFAQTMTEILRPLLIEAQTRQGNASAGQFEALTSQVGSQIRLIEEQIKTQPYERALKNAQTGQAVSTQDLNEQLKALRQVQTTLEQLQVNQAKAGSEFFGGAIGEQQPLIKLLLQILSTGAQGARSLR